MDQSSERFDLVDESGRRIGSALRSECHGNPNLLHSVVHCLVLHPDGRILLQKRAADKDIQPGKWDTSVGGHFAPGETAEQALVREVGEEIGYALSPDAAQFCYIYIMRNKIESERVHTYCVTAAGPFHAQESEVEELRFWQPDEIDNALGSGVFTPNFEDEYQRFKQWQRHGSDI